MALEAFAGMIVSIMPVIHSEKCTTRTLSNHSSRVANGVGVQEQ